MMRFSVMLALVVGCAGAAVFADQSKAKATGQVANEGLVRSLIGKQAFDGRPSTLVACAGGNFYNTHSLGATVAGTRIKVDVISGDNIDPMATLMIVQMGPNAPGNSRSGIVFDDDSGGGRDPRIETTTAYDGNVILNVGSYDGTFGCYVVKVEVTMP